MRLCPWMQGVTRSDSADTSVHIPSGGFVTSILSLCEAEAAAMLQSSGSLATPGHDCQLLLPCLHAAFSVTARNVRPHTLALHKLLTKILIAGLSLPSLLFHSLHVSLALFYRLSPSLSSPLCLSLCLLTPSFSPPLHLLPRPPQQLVKNPSASVPPVVCELLSQCVSVCVWFLKSFAALPSPPWPILDVSLCVRICVCVCVSAYPYPCLCPLE